MNTTKIKNDKKIIEKSITKGNIPINNKLLNKYITTDEIFKYEKNYEINIIINDVELIKEINICELSIEEIKKKANEIFNKYHYDKIFINNNNHILVSKNGINESIQKIYFNRKQRELLLEHLLVFSSLGKIIEEAKLVNQAKERKNRKKYNSWNYYIDGLIINNKKYLLEFEVASLDSGENQYRIQRLKML